MSRLDVKLLLHPHLRLHLRPRLRLRLRLRLRPRLRLRLRLRLSLRPRLRPRPRLHPRLHLHLQLVNFRSSGGECHFGRVRDAPSQPRALHHLARELRRLAGGVLRLAGAFLRLARAGLRARRLAGVILGVFFRRVQRGLGKHHGGGQRLAHRRVVHRTGALRRSHAVAHRVR